MPPSTMTAMIEAPVQPDVTLSRRNRVAREAAEPAACQAAEWRVACQASIQAHPLTTAASAAASRRPTQGNKLGNYHCWNRLYDIQTGRWTTPDPIASPVTNLLDYTSCNPHRRADPTGLKPAGWSGTVTTNEDSDAGHETTWTYAIDQDKWNAGYRLFQHIREFTYVECCCGDIYVRAFEVFEAFAIQDTVTGDKQTAGSPRTRTARIMGAPQKHDLLDYATALCKGPPRTLLEFRWNEIFLAVPKMQIDPANGGTQSFRINDSLYARFFGAIALWGDAMGCSTAWDVKEASLAKGNFGRDLPGASKIDDVIDPDKVLEGSRIETKLAYSVRWRCEDGGGDAKAGDIISAGYVINTFKEQIEGGK